MILVYPYETGLNGPSEIDTQYFGKDAENFLKSINWLEDINYLGKECVTEKGRGIIIGFEDCCSANDYYFIVYLPEIGEVCYQLANHRPFIESIEI